jgi:hypothetical protein
MTTSAQALSAIEGRLQATRANNSTSQSSRLIDYIVLFALCLVAAVEIWRRVKGELFNRYRPELHYMRGPGPKFREKGGQDHSGARGR